MASKFAVRGIAQALREHLRAETITVTCLNPGNLAAEIPYEKGSEAALKAYNNERIPLQDVVILVKSLITLSPAACLKEINMPATKDTNL